jgi:hypothetical protein
MKMAIVNAGGWLAQQSRDVVIIDIADTASELYRPGTHSLRAPISAPRALTNGVTGSVG